jgi:hypothetical protein
VELVMVCRSVSRPASGPICCEPVDSTHPDTQGVAEAVGTSKSTVERQVSQCGTGDDRGEAVETTGLDGKTYPRRNSGGGYRGELKPHMRLNRAVKAIQGIDVAAAKDQAELRQQLQDTRKLVCELIDKLLASIQPAHEAG